MVPVTRLVLLAALLLPGCFRSEVMAPGRALVLWQRAVPRATSTGKAPAAGARALTLEQALARALRHNPSLKVLRARLAEARAARGAATQLQNPQLRVNNIEVDKIAEDRPELDLALRVPIPQPWVLDARARKAELAAEEQRARLEQGRRNLALEIRRLFVVLASLAQERRELKGSLDVLAGHVKRVEQALAAGEATRFDLATARLRMAEVDDRRASVQANHRKAASRLRLLVGVGPAEVVTFKVTPPAAAPGPRKLDDRALVKQALRRQPSLREAAARVGQAEADAYIARARRWPWLRYAEVSYGLTSDPSPDPLNFDFSLSITVPLLSWNGGRIAERTARLARRRLEEKARLGEVARVVSRACDRTRITGARLREMERTLLPAVKDTGAALAEAGARDAIKPLDAIQVETRRIRARRRYLRARRDHALARVELAAAVGAERGKEL